MNNLQDIIKILNKPKEIKQIEKMKVLPKAVIVDVDYTTIYPFHEGVFPDTKYLLNKCVWNILKALDCKIIFVTCRHELMREETQEVLDEFGFKDYILYMRNEGPCFYDEGYQKVRPDHEIKLDIYRNKIKPYYVVKYILDDKEKIVSAFKEEGIEGLGFFRDTE